MSFQTALLDVDLLDSKPWVDANGYLRHGKDKYVHRTLAEYYYDRELRKSEVVHHIDRNKLNNSRENLLILANQHEHMIQHAKEDIEFAGGNWTIHSICGECKQLKLRKDFCRCRTLWNGISRICRLCTSVRKTKLYKEGKLNTWNWKIRLAQQYRRIKTNYTKRAISWL